MKVLFDSQVFDGQRIGGISRYFSILASELPKLGVQVSTGLLSTNNVYMRSRHPLSFVGFLRKKNKTYSRMLMRYSKYDVFHPTYYFTHVLRYKRPNAPLVVTVHDLIQEKCSLGIERCKELDFVCAEKAKIVAAADRVIAISENTKRDIMDVWGVDERKIDVVYHGPMWSPSLVPTPAVLPFSGDYILFVGNRKDKYKNFEEFIIAASQVVKRYGLQIVCTGESFSPSEAEFLKKYGVDQITHTLFVNESTLLWLYQNACCFVFPSYYEGFGIPILEAFHNNCPVCLSNASCFPEVAGDAAIYFNPNDAQSMHDTLKEILSSQALREELQQKGALHSKEYSLERMVEQTCNVYRKL